MSEFPVKPIWPYINVKQGYAFDSEDFSASGDLPLIRIRDILAEDFETFVGSEMVPDDSYLVENGDLVIGMDGDFNSTIWTRGRGALNQRVCKVVTSASLDLRYLAYGIQQPLLRINELRYATTVKHLSQDDIYAVRIPLPPLETQRRIADYLDRETAEIDEMVRALDEYSEAIRTRTDSWIRTVAMGEDSNPYGRVPLKLMFRRISSGTTPKGDDWYVHSGNGIPWVTTSELRENLISQTLKDVTSEAVQSIGGLTIYPAGSILIAMYGATIGRYAKLSVPASCNQACCVLSEPVGVDSEYVFQVLRGFQNDLVKFGQGGGQPNISQRTVGDFKIPLPPKTEQKKIAGQISGQVEFAGRIHSRIEALRSLLLKRRQVLINDVVTGKKQV